MIGGWNVHAMDLGIGDWVAVPANALAEWRVDTFDVDPDGQWFVVLQPEVRSFSLVIDWQRLLDRSPQ